MTTYHLTANVRDYDLNDVKKALQRSLDDAWLAGKQAVSLRNTNSTSTLTLTDCNNAKLPCNASTVLAEVVAKAEAGDKRACIIDGTSYTWDDVVEALKVTDGKASRVVLDGRHSSLGYMGAGAIIAKLGKTDVKVGAPETHNCAPDVDEWHFAVVSNVVHKDARGMGKWAILNAMFTNTDGRKFNAESDVPATTRGDKQVCFRLFWFETQLRRLPEGERTWDFDDFKAKGVHTFGPLQAVYKLLYKNNKKTEKAKELGLDGIPAFVQEKLYEQAKDSPERATPILKADAIRDLADEADKRDADSLVARVLRAIVNNDNDAAEVAVMEVTKVTDEKANK